MKNKILAILFIYIYIYGITIQNAWALSDSTSFNPQSVMVAAANNSVPTGTVMIWTQEEIPEGWLECNGQPVNPEYELYKTMKKTPNYQGMFLRGAGTQSINHGSYGNVIHGAKLGEIQGDTIRKKANDKVDYFLLPAGYNGSLEWYNGGHYAKNGPGGGSGGYVEYKLPSIYDGVPASEENRPVNIGVKYIIKAE